eukprot:PhM_4_TR1682/c0_g1_i1/m.74859
MTYSVPLATRCRSSRRPPVATADVGTIFTLESNRGLFTVIQPPVGVVAARCRGSLYCVTTSSASKADSIGEVLREIEFTDFAPRGLIDVTATATAEGATSKRHIRFDKDSGCRGGREGGGGGGGGGGRVGGDVADSADEIQDEDDVDEADDVRDIPVAMSERTAGGGGGDVVGWSDCTPTDFASAGPVTSVCAAAAAVTITTDVGVGGERVRGVGSPEDSWASSNAPRRICCNVVSSMRSEATCDFTHSSSDAAWSSTRRMTVASLSPCDCTSAMLRFTRSLSTSASSRLRRTMSSSSLAWVISCCRASASASSASSLYPSILRSDGDTGEGEFVAYGGGRASCMSRAARSRQRLWCTSCSISLSMVSRAVTSWRPRRASASARRAFWTPSKASDCCRRRVSTLSLVLSISSCIERSCLWAPTTASWASERSSRVRFTRPCTCTSSSLSLCNDFSRSTAVRRPCRRSRSARTPSSCTRWMSRRRASNVSRMPSASWDSRTWSVRAAVAWAWIVSRSFWSSCTLSCSALSWSLPSAMSFFIVVSVPWSTLIWSRTFLWVSRSDSSAARTSSQRPCISPSWYARVAIESKVSFRRRSMAISSSRAAASATVLAMLLLPPPL